MTIAPHSHPAAERVEYAVQAHLRLPPEVSDSDLERFAFTVLDALTDLPSSPALGVAVACDFTATVIEMDFDVEAAGLTELHKAVGPVIMVAQSSLPVAVRGLMICAIDDSTTDDT
jgi:hypothetical protein